MTSSKTLPILTRRTLLRHGSLAAAGIGGLALCPFDLMAWSKAPSETLVVETIYGKLRGLRKGDLCVFKGIPYGGDVTGTNRFKQAPQPKSWSGVRDALQLGAPSPQVGHGHVIADNFTGSPDKRVGIGEPEFSENCLFLNVWTPAADGKRRPVMFYNHGGGFATGSGGAWYEDGAQLARTYDVVVVTTNHRLGVLGYLYLGELGGEEYGGSGNQGLEDIAMALKWVNRNIAGFGGDPGNVMVFGESGGGAKTSCIYAMPAAKDTFNKASIESGAMLRLLSKDDATKSALALLELLNISRKDLRKLSEVPLTKLLRAQSDLTGGNPGEASHRPAGIGEFKGFAPLQDGLVMPYHPFDPGPPEFSRHKPLQVGTNKDETTYFFITHPELFDLTDASLKQRLSFIADHPEMFRLPGGSAKNRLHEYFGAKGNVDKFLAIYRAGRPKASPSDLYIAITTDIMMRNNAIKLAERKVAQKGAPVYMYMFTHDSNYVVPGTHYTEKAGHGNEILHKFDNFNTPMATQVPPGYQGWEVVDGTDPLRLQSARNMSGLWSGFAKTGHPHAAGVPEWPAYTLEWRATMMIDATCKIVDDPWGAERKMWEQITG